MRSLKEPASSRRLSTAGYLDDQVVMRSLKETAASVDSSSTCLYTFSPGLALRWAVCLFVSLWFAGAGNEALARREAAKVDAKRRLGIRLLSFKLRGTIEKSKLEAAIHRRLKRVSHCLHLLHARKMTPPKTVGKSSPNANKKPISGVFVGPLTMSIVLNLYGRAVSTKVLKHALYPEVDDCFVWGFRGRKLYPPQGKKGGELRARFLLGPMKVKRKKVKKKRRPRRRGMRVH